VVFIPDANFHGTATFTYTVTDQYGLQSTATATLDIAAVNDAPSNLGRVAERAMGVRIVGLNASLAANEEHYQLAA
jgi:hypothetical protein